MVPFNCKACGNLIETEGGKFCPSCGTELSGMGAEQPVSPPSQPASPTSVTCPNCGHENTITGGLFCQQCGNKLAQGENVILDPVPGQVVAATPYVPPSPPPTPQRKSVRGKTLKVIPIAKMFRNAEKFGGTIQLKEDGVIFSGRDTYLQCHVDDIAKVAEGNKSDILGIKMKDGVEYVFKLMGAKKWVKILNDMLQH